MTRDEYFQLKQKYANAGFGNMTDAEMSEFARYSNTFSKLLDTVPLFGGDAFNPKPRMFYRMKHIRQADRSQIVSGEKRAQRCGWQDTWIQQRRAVDYQQDERQRKVNMVVTDRTGSGDAGV